MRKTNNQNLSPKYYGHFQVKEVVGKVAYRLDLPETALIHPVFHISQPKAFHGNLPAVTHIPTWMQDSDAHLVIQPFAILDRRMVKHHNNAVVQFLTQWEGCPSSEATWEMANSFVERFPHFPIPS